VILFLLVPLEEGTTMELIEALQVLEKLGLEVTRKTVDKIAPTKLKRKRRPKARKRRPMITKARVEEIKAYIAKHPKFTNPQVGKRYDVSPSTVWRIRKGSTKGI
jgi:hypothetical protein